MLNREDLITELKNAAKAGRLLTPKHDPNNKVIYANFRTVLTHNASASLQDLICSEQYDLEAYYNKHHKKYAYVLKPFDSASYDPVGLGIPSGSSNSAGSFDTFLIASGSGDGWHIYSEDLNNIQSQILKNQVEYKGKL